MPKPPRESAHRNNNRRRKKPVTRVPYMQPKHPGCPATLLSNPYVRQIRGGLDKLEHRRHVGPAQYGSSHPYHCHMKTPSNRSNVSQTRLTQVGLSVPLRHLPFLSPTPPPPPPPPPPPVTSSMGGSRSECASNEIDWAKLSTDSSSSSVPAGGARTPQCVCSFNLTKISN